jgi:pilus assembly protein CpaC
VDCSRNFGSSFPFPVDRELSATPAGRESVLVYHSIAVTINKSVVIRLPRRATKVAVTQPKIAEVVVVAPDELLIHGKAVGATSFVVWLEESTAGKEGK